MTAALWLLTLIFFGTAHAVDWPNASNYVVELQKAGNGKHWTVDVQLMSSGSITVAPLIVDSSIGHSIIMSQLLCDIRVCPSCSYTPPPPPPPPASSSCLPINPTPSATGLDTLLVDNAQVSLFVSPANAAAAFLNGTFPTSPSNFFLAVPGNSGDDLTKLQLGALFWNGTAGRWSA
jgi:hypothetical protein